jgi:hypothetical protein
MTMSKVRNRMGLFLLGKTRRIKQAVSGVYSSPRRRIEATSIKCGFIP